MKKFLYLATLLSIIFVLPISALEAVDISANSNEISILEHSDVYFNKTLKTLKEIEEKKLFKSYHKKIINNKQSKNIVWVKFKLKNSSNMPVEKHIIMHSPSLESIALYDSIDGKPVTNGFGSNTKHSTVFYDYKIKLKPKESKVYYLRIFTRYKSFFFSLTAQDYVYFRDKDMHIQAPRLILLGLLLGFMIYSLLVSFYSRDKSYFYYAMYLLFLLWHQITFLGLIQIYLPKWFVMADMKLVIPKLGFILIFAILFAISFLKIKPTSFIFKIYMLFLAIAFIVIFFMKNLATVLIIGIFFVFFNFISGVIAYKNGVKQARLFILGFGVVSIAYIIVVLDSLGLTSFLTVIPNVLMWATALEVLLLNLAFVDRYQILQKEKEQLIATKEESIKKEVKEKTAQLDKALKEKELLLKEVHHRVKNNLQIILSIIKLQSIKLRDKQTKEMFINLENRINAISKTYNMLIVNKNIESVDMNKYTKALLRDIKESMYSYSIDKVKLIREIELTLPLKEAVYVGIIINELVTNAYKYAFDESGGEIRIELYKENGKNILKISDNGRGFDFSNKRDSLGLKLIDMLIKEQLGGNITVVSKPSVMYIIIF